MDRTITMDQAHTFAQGLIAEGWHSDDPNCVDTLQKRLQGFAATLQPDVGMRRSTGLSCPNCCAKPGEPHDPTCSSLSPAASVAAWHTGQPLPQDANAVAGRAPLIYPPDLTAELLLVLGTPNFHAAPMAHIFRNAGYDIARKSEDEQAFIIDRMVRTVLTHGEFWNVAFKAQLKAAHEVAVSRQAAQATDSAPGAKS